MKLHLAAVLLPALAQAEVTIDYKQVGAGVSFVPDLTAATGTAPYTFSWTFGDGTTSTDQNVTHKYPANADATYTVELNVTDSSSPPTTVVVNPPTTIEVNHYEYKPKSAGSIRIAHFNSGFSDGAKNTEGELAKLLKDPTWEYAKKIADVIQKNKPDMLSLQEFDHYWSMSDSKAGKASPGEVKTWDSAKTKSMVDDFQTNFLAIPQAEGNMAITYPYFFAAPCNTGVQTGFDTNNDGKIDANDAHGFGNFPGAYGMLFLSKHPFHTPRTFQHFLWKDMPDAYLPKNATTGAFYYAPEVLNVLRLSSKSHWDIPVQVNGEVIHVLQSHPTPPVFDDGTANEYPDPDVIDRNGFRNNNEIRFWKDYINSATYMYDDKKKKGGLKIGERFVVIGDLNCDPVDGDAALKPINSLLDDPLTDTSITPTSVGAEKYIPQAKPGYSNPETKTALFGLRADYVLPSVSGLEIAQAYVHWPEDKNVEAYLLDASDHMMVVVDLKIEPMSKAGKGGKVMKL